MGGENIGLYNFEIGSQQQKGVGVILDKRHQTMVMDNFYLVAIREDWEEGETKSK